MAESMTTEAPSPLMLPGSRYPTGWFQVAWSDDVAPGQVKAVQYFGREIVLWRGASGRLNASDAYCLHLGGNLGVQGTVDGEDVVCPWHGWHWSGEGRNTLIPYSAQKCKKQLQLELWTVHEWHGCVMVWHDKLGRAPQWELPDTRDFDEFEQADYYPIAPDMRVVHRIKAHPQMIAENGADPFHVAVVHGAGLVPTIKSFEFREHEFHGELAATYGAGKESTWLTPDGPVGVVMTLNLWGIGQGAVRWPDNLMRSIQLTNVTPVDDTYSDYWFCMTVVRESPESEAPSGVTRRMIDHQLATIEQDFFTWENMKVLQTPNFAPEEAPYYAALRRWAWQFYPQVGAAGAAGAEAGATVEN